MNDQSATGAGRRSAARASARCRMALLALAAPGLTGACALSAEGDLPEVEVTERDIAIPAAPLDADGGEVTLTVGFRQAPVQLGLEGAKFSRVEILGLQVAATGGVSELTFLRRLRVTVTSPEASAAGRAPIEAVRYQRTADDEVGPTLLVPSRPPADVTDLWKGSALLFALEFTGQLPTVAWSADVGLSFGATISY